MKNLSATEKKIIREILKRALEKEYTVSVWDGEEWTVKFSIAKEAIEAAIGTTDQTRLRFRSIDQTLLGDVLLVHGNDEDVVSDSSDYPEINALLEGI